MGALGHAEKSNNVIYGGDFESYSIISTPQKLEIKVHYVGSRTFLCDWFQIGKGARQGCKLSPCLFNLYAEYIMRNSELEEAQAGIKIAGRISVTSDMQMTPPLWHKVNKN